MKRWHEEKAMMKRQLAVMEMCQRQTYGRIESPRVHDRFKPLGRYRKKHALDCGNARCGICHRHKRLAKNDGRERDRLRNELSDIKPRDVA